MASTPVYILASFCYFHFLGNLILTKLSYLHHFYTSGPEFQMICLWRTVIKKSLKTLCILLSNDHSNMTAYLISNVQ